MVCLCELHRSGEKENLEHMVINPIYDTDSPNGNGGSKTSTLNVAENPQYVTRSSVTAAANYEDIDDLPCRPKGA